MILFAPSGPQFVWLYIGLLGVALVVAAILRQALRAPSGDPGDVSLDDPYEVAYLVGGGRTAVDVAIVTLVGRNAISITPTRRFAMAGPQAAARTRWSGPSSPPSRPGPRGAWRGGRASRPARSGAPAGRS